MVQISPPARTVSAEAAELRDRRALLAIQGSSGQITVVELTGSYHKVWKAAGK